MVAIFFSHFVLEKLLFQLLFLPLDVPVQLFSHGVVCCYFCTKGLQFVYVLASIVFIYLCCVTLGGLGRKLAEEAVVNSDGVVLFCF